MVAALLNTILDPIFISVFNWGIEGAAFATVFSQGVAFILGFLYTLRLKVIPFTLPVLPKWVEVKLILTLGIPSGLQIGRDLCWDYSHYDRRQFFRRSSRGWIWCVTTD